MKKFLLLVALLSLAQFINAQSACNGAVDLNVTNAFLGAAQPDDPVIDYGCINAAGRHVWYGYFTVCTQGQVVLTTTVPSSANDVDIVVWGPFVTTGVLCTQLTSGTVAACTATANNMEQAAISVVMPGFVYMVAVVADTNVQIPTYSTAGSTAIITGSCPPLTNCFPNAGYEMLCNVTVDSATQEYKLTWSELPGNPVSYFGILKADYLGNPQQIDTVHVTSLSEYIDTSADPDVHTEQYSIITYDTCGTFWQTSGYIQPVFCQSSLSTQGTVNVAWSAYFDTHMNGPAYYVIYRGATPASMVSIDTVASFVNNYTDMNPLIGTSYYKIGTALYSACVPMRLQQNASASVYPVQSYSNAAPITVVGMTENTLQEVSLYPNPSDGNFTVRNITGNAVLNVYDVSGRIVSQQQLQQNTSQQITLSGIEAGVYLVTIENETGFYREEIVVQH